MPASPPTLQWPRNIENIMSLESILELHRGGALIAAETQYRDYLTTHPDDGDALHLLGVLRQQRGDHAEAAELIRRALAIAPDHAPFHLSLGGVLLQTADEADAQHYRRHV